MNERQTLLASALTAIGASLCCVGPLVLLTLGIGGAWVSYLTKLEPFRPVFVGLTAVFIVLAWRKLYRTPDCQPGQYCANPAVTRRQKLLFWMVTPVLIGLAASPWLIPYFA
jgi:mercuric ion transport protein